MNELDYLKKKQKSITSHRYTGIIIHCAYTCILYSGHDNNIIAWETQVLKLYRMNNADDVLVGNINYWTSKRASSINNYASLKSPNRRSITRKTKCPRYLHNVCFRPISTLLHIIVNDRRFRLGLRRLTRIPTDTQSVILLLLLI